MDCSIPGFSVYGDSPGNSGVCCHALLQGGGLSNPGIKPRSPALQADSLPSELPGKPKNTGVGNILSPGDLLDPGTEPGSPALQVDSLLAELPGKPFVVITIIKNECTSIF